MNTKMKQSKWASSESEETSITTRDDFCSVIVRESSWSQWNGTRQMHQIESIPSSSRTLWIQQENSGNMLQSTCLRRR